MERDRFQTIEIRSWRQHVATLALNCAGSDRVSTSGKALSGLRSFELTLAARNAPQKPFIHFM